MIDVLRDNLRFCRRRLLAVVEALGPDDPDCRPVPTMMSPREQLVHVAVAERHWRRRCTGEAPPDESEAGQLAVAELVSLLAAERSITEAWLGSVDEADLARSIDDGHGRALSVGWVICHLARHDAHHAGYILSLWRTRHPEAVIASGYAAIEDGLRE